MALTQAPHNVNAAAAKNLLKRPEIFSTLEEIAKEEMLIPTLKVRGGDGWDFHDVGVVGASLALAKAYFAGMEAAALEPTANAAPEPTAKFSQDEIGFIQLASNKVLAAVARGELDLNALALRTLQARGHDEDEK